MGWLTKMVVLVSLQHVAPLCGAPHHQHYQERRPAVTDEAALSLSAYIASAASAASAASDPSADLVFQTPDNDTPEETPNLDQTDYLLPIETLTRNGVDEKYRIIQNYLIALLLTPENGKGLPILYVDEYPDEEENNVNHTEDNLSSDFIEKPPKRSRYYRRYPWKRQNSRLAYDAENRYICQPNKDDVFRLLVALHESRSGSRGRTINFCNRKRPATTVFTNVRFLG